MHAFIFSMGTSHPLQLVGVSYSPQKFRGTVLLECKDSSLLRLRMCLVEDFQLGYLVDFVFLELPSFGSSLIWWSSELASYRPSMF